MIYAHKKLNELETLEEHSIKTLNNLNQQHIKTSNKLLNNFLNSINVESLNFLTTINNFNQLNLDSILEINEKLLREFIYNHDYSKNTRYFQDYLLNNNILINKNSKNHSLKSAIYLFYKCTEESYIETNFNNFNYDYLNLYYFICFQYFLCVTKHHTEISDLNLEYFNNMLDKFYNNEILDIDYLQEIDLDVLKFTHEQLIQENQLINLEFLMYFRYNRGVLSYCDHSATFNFYTGNSYTKNRFNSLQIAEIKSKYSTSFYNESLNNYESLSEINKLRCDFIRELDVNYTSDACSIEYLEAPTGSGKTHLSLRYAIKSLKDGCKVIYSTQFNSVNEQTYKTFMNILQPNIDKTSENYYDLLLNNSNNEINHNLGIDSYDESLIKNELLEYQFSLISNQRLLSILFGGSLRDAKAFQSLENSVIIIDELQNINIELWKYISKVLNILVKFFNCRVLVMSATLPDLSIFSDNPPINLIQDISLINNVIFKERVLFSDELLYSQNQLVDLNNKLLSNLGKRQLVEFVIKDSAIKFYNRIIQDLEYSDCTILLITGDTKQSERLKIIDMVSRKNNEGDFLLKNVIIIATQVIEAGVDIDMEIGYKNISRIDSEIQFSGRINRNNGINKGVVYLFNYNNVDYQKTAFEKFGVSLPEYFNQVKNFDYLTSFNKIIENIHDIGYRDFDNFNNHLENGDLKKAIDIIKINNMNLKVIVNNEESRGSIEKYFQILRDRTLTFSERRILLSKYLVELQKYTITIKNNRKNKSKIEEDSNTEIVISDNLYVITDNLYHELVIVN